MQHVKEHGRAPDSVEPTSMNGVSITFNSDISDENILGSQVQKLQRDIISKLGVLGFEVEHEFDEPIDIVEGLKVNPRRMSIDQEKGSNAMTLNFGLNNLYNEGEDEKEINTSKMSDNTIQNIIDGMKTKGTKYVEEDGKIITYSPKEYSNVQDAVKGLLEGTAKNALKDSALLQEIRKQNINPFTKFSNFENIL